MKWLLYLLAFAGGIALPMQVGLNTALRTHLGNPLQVTFVSFSIGAAAALIYSLAARYPIPTMQSVAGSSWWMWFGGILGAFYVVTTIVAAPQIGAAITLGLVIAGQMTASLVLDHIGFAGLTPHPISFWRVVGALLVIGGVTVMTLAQNAKIAVPH